MLKLKTITCCMTLVILGSEIVVSQIPAKGSDFPTLSVLRWGISIQEARDLISPKREIQKPTSTMLSYEDTILHANAMIKLKFTEDNFS